MVGGHSSCGMVVVREGRGGEGRGGREGGGGGGEEKGGWLSLCGRG